MARGAAVWERGGAGLSVPWAGAIREAFRTASAGCAAFTMKCNSVWIAAKASWIEKSSVTGKEFLTFRALMNRL